MNNTDKLLRAFIEASGFDIEEVETTKDFYSPQWINTDGSLMDGAVPMGTVKDIDYKVTKKGIDWEYKEPKKIPRSHFIEAAKSDIKRDISTTSNDSALQYLMRNFIEDEDDNT